MHGAGNRILLSGIVATLVAAVLIGIGGMLSGCADDVCRSDLPPLKCWVR